nr:hypothetical protein [Tanacetum cinerariifolium]
MGDENPTRTLGDYFKPSHEGYKNTIELLVGNNVGKNVPAFILISLRDQANNSLERLPAGSITTWEDLTTRGIKTFDTLADLGSCVNIIPLYLFKKINIRLLEKIDHIFGLANETKSYPVGIVKDVEVHIGKLKQLNDFYVIDMKKDAETPLLVGRGFLATANAVIDYRMAKIVVGEGITRSVFGVKGVDLGEEEAPYWTTHGKRESYKLHTGTNGVDKPPKNEERSWHAKIRLIDPDKEEFTKTLQSIPPQGSSLEEKFQRKSLTWTTSTTIKHVNSSLDTRLINKHKLSFLEDTTVLESFPPLTTPVTTTTGNAPGKSSYANITGKPSGKKVNVCTLFTPEGNGINVVVLVDSIRAISERFANIAYVFFLEKKVAYHVVSNYHPNENLLKEYVSTVPVWVKLHGVTITAFNEDGLSAIATKLGAGEKKTVKKPSQTSRGVSVGPKIGFKPHKNYRPIFKNPIVSSSGNKKNGVNPIIEVSNSNPFDVLNSINNDGEFGANSSNVPIDNDDYDSYGDDMYENHDLFENLRSICDDLVITYPPME